MKHFVQANRLETQLEGEREGAYFFIPVQKLSGDTLEAQMHDLKGQEETSTRAGTGVVPMMVKKGRYQGETAEI